ncbi:MAG: HdeD family acid-resistance protein [Solirubrobacteraceae bacterium]
MSSTSFGSREIRALTWGWWLALLIGALSIVAGVIVILKPSNSLSTLAVILGIFILIDGIFEIAGAILGDTESRGLLAVIGALSVIAGVLLIRHPLGGVRAVALLLGIWLIAAGVVRLISAFAFPGDRIWRIIVALVLGIFGIVIVSAPHIGYATLALIAGICFICYGIGMLAVGWAMRAIRQKGAAIDPDATALT